MPLSIDAFSKLILVTSPTTEVDAQALSDFVEDFMASPEGMVTDGTWPGFAGVGDIMNPQGKIEDAANPGVFSQIILSMNPGWQIQFWGGSGYTRIFGGKIVGGVSDQPMKATGTAGDITVLESPVDGVTVEVGSGVTGQDKLDIAALVWEELEASHQTVGTMGRWLSFIRKLVGNKASIAPDDSTSTIFEDDKSTPYHVFDHPDVRNRDPQ